MNWRVFTAMAALFGAVAFASCDSGKNDDDLCPGETRILDPSGGCCDDNDYSGFCDYKEPAIQEQDDAVTSYDSDDRTKPFGSNPYQGPKFESTNEYCSDGQDNNGNGYLDCKDYSCRFNPHVTVCGDGENTNELCSDGLDNDESGHQDCKDWSCYANPFVTICEPLENRVDTCSDGIDNNNNEYIDCEDYGCSINPFIDVCK